MGTIRKRTRVAVSFPFNKLGDPLALHCIDHELLVLSHPFQQDHSHFLRLQLYSLLCPRHHAVFPPFRRLGLQIIPSAHHTDCGAHNHVQSHIYSNRIPYQQAYCHTTQHV